ncbi:MAG: S9 family peptidase, partial [Bacteroidetes bacterium]
YDLATRTFSAVTPGISWDVETFDLSKDGRSLVFTVNEGGFTALYFMDTRSSKFRKVEGLPKGVVGGLKFHPDGRQVAMSINTSSTPSDVFVWDSKKGTFTRWTFSEVGGLNPATFITPEIVQYPTFDSVNGKPRMIPALLYKPKTATGKFPVVISIHGGPEGQSLPTFNPFFQYLLNEKGIALLVPNVRGSTGYGKTYVSLDDAYLRENSVKDIGTLLDWIGKQSDLDPGRVMVYGGSYGGYMTLACMTHFNDRLKGGIDLFGISNWVTFLENTSGYRQDLRRVEYGDERDPKMRAFLTEISPIQHIGNITKPMFIFQGKNDPRVPLSESEQMVQALKDRDLSIWYIMAKDEGHGLSKKANRDMVNAAMVLFMTNLL